MTGTTSYCASSGTIATNPSSAMSARKAHVTATPITSSHKSALVGSEEATHARAIAAAASAASRVMATPTRSSAYAGAARITEEAGRDGRVHAA
jgi:hypothetical protein